MGKILVIRGSDFSQNRIEKVDIMKQVEKGVDNQTPNSSTVSVKNPKNND